MQHSASIFFLPGPVRLHRSQERQFKTVKPIEAGKWKKNNTNNNYEVATSPPQQQSKNDCWMTNNSVVARKRLSRGCVP
jgi:hypothetical protein